MSGSLAVCRIVINLQVFDMRRSMASIVTGQTIVELVFIPPGEFLMGSSNMLFSESPAHRAMIRAGFYLGTYPVTQAQWTAVKESNPSHFATCADRPVDSISWEDATSFCQMLTDRCGRRIRLPSEAEWEYACRAGSAGEFFFGQAGPFIDDSEISSAIRMELTEYAWFDLNSGDNTQPVGRKRPNPWGLHDIVGNVWEWCPMFGTTTTSEPPRMAARGCQPVIGNHDAVCVAEPGT
jgi:formylglycine-generating enzyme required for sulfatase activity